MNSLKEFREAVGAEGAVAVKGGGTRWNVGRAPSHSTSTRAKEVSAPTGVDLFEPAEMTVRVGAGTTLEDLSSLLAEHGQEVALDGPQGATVGGALMVGWSPLRSGRLGEATDALLQADCIGSDGAEFTAGGPTVKNVTGYDLCRLLVGSLGTLAMVGRVILRTRPLPTTGLWMTGEEQPATAQSVLYRPACVLWDGLQTTVRIEGHRDDVSIQKSGLEALGFSEVEAPNLPQHRNQWTGVLPLGGVLQVGSGVVHQPDRPVPPDIPSEIAALSERLRHNFDPRKRLNPECDPCRVSA